MGNIKVAVIGLGYVGLPLARLFATRYPVIGFDVKVERVAALKAGKDVTQEISDECLPAVLLPGLPVTAPVAVMPVKQVMMAPVSVEQVL